MAHYSFVRLSDQETIPMLANSDALALALLGQREGVADLSLVGSSEPLYVFAKFEHHTAWCRPSVPVYRAS